MKYGKGLVGACPDCGQPVSADARKCPSCGAVRAALPGKPRPTGVELFAAMLVLVGGLSGLALMEWRREQDPYYLTCIAYGVVVLVIVVVRLRWRTTADEKNEPEPPEDSL